MGVYFLNDIDDKELNKFYDNIVFGGSGGIVVLWIFYVYYICI